jgi:hypothetical protein
MTIETKIIVGFDRGGLRSSEPQTVTSIVRLQTNDEFERIRK